MKYILFLLFLIIFSLKTQAQKRGDPNVYYWTIWFTTTAYPANFDGPGKGCKWVQSFFNPEEATKYYKRLKSTGKVIIWGKHSSKVDTASVYIDSFNMITRKYSFESH